jgi:hypothetical protein
MPYVGQSPTAAGINNLMKKAKTAFFTLSTVLVAIIP